MAEKMETKKKFDGENVEILAETYEDGTPPKADRWRGKLKNREQMLKYIKTGQRYWYDEDSYGSEKRKTPA